MYLLTTTDQTDLIGSKHREMWVGHQSTIDKNSIWVRAISVRLYQIYFQNISIVQYYCNIRLSKID